MENYYYYDIFQTSVTQVSVHTRSHEVHLFFMKIL